MTLYTFEVSYLYLFCNIFKEVFFVIYFCIDLPVIWNVFETKGCV